MESVLKGCVVYCLSIWIQMDVSDTHTLVLKQKEKVDKCFSHYFVSTIKSTNGLGITKKGKYDDGKIKFFILGKGKKPERQ